MSIIVAEKEAKLAPLLKYILCIHYLIRFKKDQGKVQSLIDTDNEVNIMILASAAKLDLKVQIIDVRAQKINGSSLPTYKIIIAGFQVLNKLDRACFF